MDAFACMCVRVMNFAQKKSSEYRKVRERVLRGRDVKENRVRVARKRTECIERIKNSVYIVI